MHRSNPLPAARLLRVAAVAPALVLAAASAAPRPAGAEGEPPAAFPETVAAPRGPLGPPPDSAGRPPDPDDFAARPLARLAFGSCLHQDKEQPIWDAVVTFRPDLFLFLGDNVYGDTTDMDVLRAKWDRLAAKPGLQRLREIACIDGTWDDHDFGRNDAGREYAEKATSKAIMLDFFGEPDDAPRREREGVHTSYVLGPEGRRVQVILLDLRWWRSKLVTGPRSEGRRVRHAGTYVPHRDPDATMLGEAQWAWLEAQLREPAEFRIIGSSTQFGAEFNGWEAWANLPHERERLLETIERTRAEGVVMLSGDTHWAECSLLERPGLYPIHDLTSSGMTEVWSGVAPNRVRVDVPYLARNFGTLAFDWSAGEPAVEIAIRAEDGAVVLRRRIARSELTFAAAAEAASMPPPTAADFAGTWLTDRGLMVLEDAGDGRVRGRCGDGLVIEGTVEAADSSPWTSGGPEARRLQQEVRRLRREQLGDRAEGGPGDAALFARWRTRSGENGGPVVFRLTRDRRHVQGGWGFAAEGRGGTDPRFGLPYSWTGRRWEP